MGASFGRPPSSPNFSVRSPIIDFKLLEEVLPLSGSPGSEFVGVLSQGWLQN